jgi:hypothetical protein
MGAAAGTWRSPVVGSYARARATQVPDGDGIEVFSRASVEAGIGPWTVANVTAPAELRLYRADVTELSLLAPRQQGSRYPRPSWFDDALDCVSPEPVHER